MGWVGCGREEGVVWCVGGSMDMTHMSPRGWGRGTVSRLLRMISIDACFISQMRGGGLQETGGDHALCTYAAQAVRGL